jgi:hypothetical protein
MTEASKPTKATTEAEEVEARHNHQADRAPTPEEERAAERGKEEAGADPTEVAEHFEEMADIGAHVKGEGEIK